MYNALEWIVRALVIIIFGWYFLKLLRVRKEISNSLELATNFFEKDITKSILANSFPTIEKRMDELGVLRQAWHEFDASLVKVGQSVSTTVEADIYFNEYVLVDLPLQLEIMRNIPAILTSLGIIGTFIGVLSGLNGYDAHGVEAVRNTVSNLFTGVQSAFFNSLLAIFLAVLFTCSEKFIVNGLYTKVARLQRSINRLFNRSISDDYLQRMLSQMEEQSQAMKSFSQDLSESIKVAMDELVNKQNTVMRESNEHLSQTIRTSLMEQLAPAMDKIGVVMEEVQKTQADAGQETMRNMVSEFRESLQADSNTQMQQMLEAISGTSTLLGSIKTELGGFIGTMQEQARIQQEMVKNQIGEITSQAAAGQMQLREEFSGFINSVGQTIENIQSQMADQSSQAVKSVANELTDMVAQTQQQSVENNRLFKEMLQSMKNETQAQMTETTTQFTSAVNDTVQKMGREVEGLLADSVQMNNTMMTRVDSMIHNVEALANKTTAASADMANRLKTGLDSMTGLFTKAQELSRTYGDLLLSSKEAVAGMSTGLMQISAASKSISASAESYQQIQSTVLKQVEACNSQLHMIDERCQSFENLYLAYEGSAAQVAKVVEDNKTLIQCLDENITENLDTYIKATEKSIADYLTTLDSSLANNVNALSSATGNLESTLTEFLETMETLSNKRQQDNRVGRI